ncbi:MAG: dimethyl sulfoxide reductase anchor subunit [Bacteroidales bacterium]|nr:dimethyl sulfoxide reductase anchor subunit [Bacteroidales bacterium]
MENSNISLVIFTLLVQFAAGLIIMEYAAGAAGLLRLADEKTGKRIQGVALLLMISGLIASFTHLSYPLNAVNALSNLGSSWMSREIAAVSLLILVLALRFSGYFINADWLRGRSIRFISLLLAVSLIYVMIKVYSLPTMKYLSHPSLATDFVAVSLWGGVTLLVIIAGRYGGRLKSHYDIISFILIAAILANSVIFSRFAGSPDSFLVWVIVPAILSLSTSLFSAGVKLRNKKEFWSVIVTVTGLAVIIAGRILFLNYTYAVL